MQHMNTPNNMDVICERSQILYDHHGNKEFRRIVQDYGETYQNATCRDEKKRMTTQIIEAVHRTGGNY